MKPLSFLLQHTACKKFLTMKRTNVSFYDSVTANEPIRPYTLDAGKGDSNEFYRDLEIFTTVVIRKGFSRLNDIITDYKCTTGKDVPNEEVLLDFLIAGILWKEYAGIYVPMLKVKKNLLTFLYDLRSYPSLKNTVDRLRGKLASTWLIQQSRRNREVNITNLDYLACFLDATCEFREELKTLSAIRHFFGGKERAMAGKYLERIVEFAGWFKNSSFYCLGKYTSGVNDFLGAHPKNYEGREDYFFCGRRESEYHLNMVGAEILNRSLKKEFEKTDEKILLLPTCMSLRGSACRAKVLNGDLSCTHCTPACNISRATREMTKKGIRTVLIRHSSSFSKWLEPWSHQKTTGLIGVACVLNLLAGGFEMKRLGIPSQCIFLNHPGCRKHWKSGNPSEIDLFAACKTACIKEEPAPIHQ